MILQIEPYFQSVLGVFYLAYVVLARILWMQLNYDAVIRWDLSILTSFILEIQTHQRIFLFKTDLIP